MTGLRVATFNIHHGADARGRLDLDRTAAAIAGLRADVVGLQEVDVRFGARSLDQDQASLLAEASRMHVRFGAAITRPGGGPGEGRGGDDGPGTDGERGGYGVALLSRMPIRTAQMHPLPGARDGRALREPRGVLDATVEVPGAGPVRVLVTHLDHDHRDHRHAQVREILRRNAGDARPILLLGDFNADPSAAELTALRAGGFRDAALEAAQGGQGREPWAGPRGPQRRGTARFGAELLGAWSSSARIRSVLRGVVPHGSVRATWPARVPYRRLDAIWLRGPVRAREVHAVRSLASDHRPLLAHLDLG